ncbi:hypothetical protein EZV73_04385 [Acidaminobacter sp. JC074]|uniref:hypothetical protein n=1 Tax=Acidaminobacter sp. JC074 TaxID=2530199 RepID=UPI001F0D18F3|nr:hypothetical protein [Acidaminobacter sp. JC074]MCH4886791.1 hypothetical protein [Acidaminobacter sp. JC074]
MSEELLQIDSDQFPCPSCGAFMVYSPQSHGLKCDYCGHEVDITKDNREIKEHALDRMDETFNHEWASDKRVIKCESCGGESMITTTDLTSACVFCGSAHVVVETMKEGIPPEGILPFMITRHAAKEGIDKWVSSKFYAPKTLKDLKRLDTIKSVYIPYFTYDAETSTFYTARRGDHYYVTRTKVVDGKTKTVRERRTRWRRVEGVYKEAFDDVLVHASKKVEESLIAKMKSFDLSKVEAFQEAYLIGHHAERYNKSLGDGFDDACEIMDQAIYSGIRHQVGGDEFQLTHHQTNYGNTTYKHLLLPVWMTHYTFKEKMYHVYINGQTGRVVGDYPKSIWKILLTIGGFLAVAFIIYFVLTRF